MVAFAAPRGLILLAPEQAHQMRNIRLGRCLRRGTLLFRHYLEAFVQIRLGNFLWLSFNFFCRGLLWFIGGGLRGPATNDFPFVVASVETLGANNTSLGQFSVLGTSFSIAT